jgi:NitT/TauT family transport system ATP-binding protein
VDVGALDPGIRADIHTLMLDLWQETGMTVVMVTHDLSEAFRLGTRVIALERKRKRPEELQRYGAQIQQDIDVWPKKQPRLLSGAGQVVSIVPPVEASSPI